MSMTADSGAEQILAIILIMMALAFISACFLERREKRKDDDLVEGPDRPSAESAEDPDQEDVG